MAATYLGVAPDALDRMLASPLSSPIARGTGSPAARSPLSPLQGVSGGRLDGRQLAERARMKGENVDLFYPQKSRVWVFNNPEANAKIHQQQRDYRAELDKQILDRQSREAAEREQDRYYFFVETVLHRGRADERLEYEEMMVVVLVLHFW